ncbi:MULTISPECIES: 23S rRNA (pseudouridine(1915)-N(3))-methyltransferase RlmH [unclassified Gemella]|uniref:23S rRNA (pseudouridine(1915)-N(3))-methyltransferase RlmH n=1 Tax=unclassified Gemella TaxID=2624949 RepID=UPI0010732E32|nr:MULTISPECIES: 23S rRNA (pseudouridine(1915)-N(3))-methyltransferase RlmH [unclassified Gemella]MBF0710046.1 23S rRNA (pseudouridine(1915)-N(3))-methyltransferase RlmH [Gemella sp. GL1.1]MBF0746125.1 23S rRNA (pseudouridine(1915)-N(3))-methyltransferase RlmH [Gemella sp. 19428wG2_WT2a]NYS27390.1 23S rRNA (pseudouridine(1915)-N(3))-methyltransferase RlmH [Gemella sp. GL1]TFU60414.1 23S rRNA (pseudouridine(1915)-N(3))-methyltransferase RlmH [Gemella sp. WT2a]
MKISIVCIGKIKEKFYKDAINEYLKRLSAYTKLNIIELNDEKVKNENESEIKLAMDKEGKNILSKIKDGQFLVTLEILGNNFSSEELASKINFLALQGSSDIVFVIGGSYGLSDEVKSRSDFALSFSRMTFPHQLMRVVLVEQIYRAFKIIKKEPYHK